MSSPENHIADYLDGQLYGTELAAFEAALAIDSGLRDAVALQRRIETNLGSMNDHEEISALIREAETAHPYQTRKPVIRHLAPWLAAAALVLFAFGAWYIINQREPDVSTLATRYTGENKPASILPGRISLLRANSEVTSPLREADNLIDSARIMAYLGDYTRALALYQAIPTAGQSDSLRFETALILLQLQKPTPALELLQNISTNYEGGWYWYQAIAYLQRGEIRQARAQIDNLLKVKGSPYRNEALRLLEELP